MDDDESAQNMTESDARIAHEHKGARLAGEILDHLVPAEALAEAPVR